MGDLRFFLSFSFPTLLLNFSLVREALFSLYFLQRPVEVSGECWKTPPRNPVSSAVVCHRRWHRRRQKQIKPLFLKFFYAFHPFFPLYSILPSKFPNPNLKPLDLETKRRMEKKGKNYLLPSIRLCSRGDSGSASLMCVCGCLFVDSVCVCGSVLRFVMTWYGGWRLCEAVCVELCVCVREIVWLCCCVLLRVCVRESVWLFCFLFIASFLIVNSRPMNLLYKIGPLFVYLVLLVLFCWILT